MSDYLVKSDNKEKKIVEIKTSNYYTFSPRKESLKKISSVTIYDEDIVNEILIKKIYVKYQKILNLFLASQDEDDEGGYDIALDEIYRLKDIIEYKYKKLIKKEAYDKFISDLVNLEEHIYLKKSERTQIMGR